ncbi:transcriptional regulator [Neisseria zoodegmatis]|uniref:Transcriptional regulator n=1 Tax=Neisseria zoodegmatis TaxID=326523 RepID=A0AB38DN65_9NEIS|nr:hypothetical protein BWD10_10290 [Neisseria zoodegmatis]SNU78652.1 transcriptional regulator [Neisseria zoodegmatis]
MKVDFSQNIELGAYELHKLIEQLAEQGITLTSLPKSGPGIKLRAQSEQWASRVVPGKGGKGGNKTIYILPGYVIEELIEKGLLNLFEEAAEEISQAATDESIYKSIYISNAASSAPNKQREIAAIYSTDPIPASMEDLVSGYKAWASHQDTANIVPVRYHINVFGSAGNGTISWQAEETEAMWFRASFFKHLGVNPNRCFCTRVKGDSMFPTLIDLGTVLWCATAKYTEEGIYLFRQYDEIRIKRLQRLNAHTFNIISDNPNKGIYPTTELDLSQTEPHDFEILGRYLWSCGIAK